MLVVPDTNNSNYILTLSHWLLCSIKSIIGKNGYIFQLTYSYSFAKKVIRSLNSMMSIAGDGPHCKEVLLKISNNSFGKNCSYIIFSHMGFSIHL